MPPKELSLEEASHNSPIGHYNKLPVGHIRLIQLWRTEDNEIEASLNEHPLAEAPKYEYKALSHVWGDTHPQATLRCNNMEWRITANLYLALRAIMDPLPIGSRFTMWIDQLCINQDDLIEKGTQVRLMGSIFQQAKRVLVWLGQSSLDVTIMGACMEMLPDMITTINESVDELGPDFWVHSRAGLPDENHPAWTLLCELISAPWFRRLWTFQEAVMAKEVVIFFGNQIIGLDFIFALAEAARYAALLPQRKIYMPGSAQVSALEWFRNRYQEQGMILFSNLLAIAGKKQCALNVDRVYGVMGLLDDVDKYGIAVDYTRDYESVFLDALKAAISYDTEYHLLNLSRQYGDQHGFPTWCPNIIAHSQREALRAGHYHAATRVRSYKDALDPPPICCVVANSNFLKVQGVLVDTVKEIARARYPGNEIATLREAQVLRMIFNDECLTLARSTIPDSSAVFEVHACTLIADILGAFGRDSPHKLDGYRNYFEVDLTKPDPWDHLDPKGRALADLYQRSVSSACEARSYFSTEGGRLAIGPEETQPGDAICLFLGARTPFILRPTSNESYIFIGDSYVHSLMDCEVLDMLDTGMVERRDFVIQ